MAPILASAAMPGEDMVSLTERIPDVCWITLSAGEWRHLEQVLVFRCTGTGPYVAEIGLSENQRVRLRKGHPAGATVRVDLELPMLESE